MTPYYADDWLTVYHGDAGAVLAELPAESVHCVVTSPPYWGLRDYGEPGQLGLEPTPEAYVESLVAVFRDVRRVLRSDGTVWLNLGDSYTSAGGGGEARMTELHGERDTDFRRGVLVEGRSGKRPYASAGLKPKDLVGIPWMVAFALRADGWYLRSDIIWAKPNPMPESVTDRPTKSHEYLFLLSKSPRYYFDADAVREPHESRPQRRFTNGVAPEREAVIAGGLGPVAGIRDRTRTEVANDGNPAGRNIRSVWTVATQPYPGAHFATFPPKLIEPCIKAGTSEKGVCPECGAPWERIVDIQRGERDDTGRTHSTKEQRNGKTPVPERGWESVRATTAWQSTCDCVRGMRGGPFRRVPGRSAVDGDGLVPVPATVLDPFAGSGTTGMVAQSLSRRAVLIDLSMDYLGQLMDRNREIPLGLGA